MSRPLLLDLFCGAGGCAVGYHRAGFDVVGVDHVQQPRYPFEFIKMDALAFLDGRRMDRYAAIHASPPCQAFSAMNRAVKAKHSDHIKLVRPNLQRIGLPWVIENVEYAPLFQPVMLCGTMFGLKVRRHRCFELSFRVSELLPECQCANGVMRGRLVGHRCGGKVAPGRTKPPPFTVGEQREAIGVPWMTGREARQAIPPAYTEWVGRQLLAALQNLVD